MPAVPGPDNSSRARPAAPDGPPGLVLFDIDGTLLVAGDADHKAALIGAVADVYGVAISFAGFSLGGRLDAEIVRVLAGGAGVPAATVERDLPRAMARMGERFTEAFSHDGYAARALPGAVAAVAAVHADGFTTGVLTGNARSIAVARLRATGFAGLLDVGAFGDRAHARADLVAEACAVASARHGRPHVAARTVLVGDTTRDVEAARAAGARVVAVATGVIPKAQLAAAAPDALLDDLTDTAALVGAVRALLA
jgi:phosphoglycolate phosphatase-like HAD superfamily hydrolase